MDSCIYIPKHKNKDSKLFSDLMSITKDRDTTIALYGLSKSKELMDNLNIMEYYSNGEPKASALIDALGKPKEILGEKNYIKFIEDLENLSDTYSSYSSAYEKFNSLTDKYDNEASFYIHKEGNSFKISAQSLSNNNPLTKNTVRNSSLRSSILSYLNNLGFDIEENSTVDNPSRFSPLEATENANKLKVMIRMAKDYSTSELTEELPSFLGKIPHDLHKVFDLLRRKDSGRLVENEDLVITVEHLKDLRPLLHTYGYVLNQSVRVDMQTVFFRKLENLCTCLGLFENAELGGRLNTENDVVKNGETLNELKMLMHHADAEIVCVVRVIYFDLNTVFFDSAVLRLIKTEKNTHQSRFSCSVFTEQGMYLALFQLERDVIIGDNTGKNLCDIQHFYGELLFQVYLPPHHSDK